MRPLIPLAALLAACGARPERPALEAADVWIEPVRVHGRVLFAGELEPVADALAEILGRHGYRVVAPAKVRALWSEARAGRLPGLDFVCEAAPPPARLVDALHPGASRAEADTRCDHEACTLTLVVLHGDAERARYVAKLPPEQDPATWAEGLRGGALRPVEPPPADEDRGLAVGGLGVAGPPGPRARIHGVVQSGPWVYDLDSERFQPRAAELLGCREPGAVWRDWWEQPFQIEIDPMGRVSRCEPQHPDHLPPPGFSCRCEVLRRMEFGIGTPGRRAAFSLHVADRRDATAETLARSAALVSARADDPTATLGTNALPPEALERCLAPVAAPLEPVEVPVRFEIGADGRVREHAADWPAALPPAAAACLDGALAGARFNCPLSGAASVEARVALRVSGG